jgi:hypothetical protein
MRPVTLRRREVHRGSGRRPLLPAPVPLAGGREWALRGDIEDFFDRIPPQAALATLREHVHDEALVTVVGHLFAGGSLAGGCLLDAYSARTWAPIPIARGH